MARSPRFRPTPCLFMFGGGGKRRICFCLSALQVARRFHFRNSLRTYESIATKNTAQRRKRGVSTAPCDCFNSYRFGNNGPAMIRPNPFEDYQRQTPQHSPTFQSRRGAGLCTKNCNVRLSGYSPRTPFGRLATLNEYTHMSNGIRRRGTVALGTSPVRIMTEPYTKPAR